jgi:plastocyanin
LRYHVKAFAGSLVAGAAAFFILTPPVWPVAAAVAASPPPQLVHIANFTFAQAAITVRRGSSVTWVNDDDIPHTVVAVDKSFKSKVLDTGDRFTFTFAKPGQFAYFCSIHPHMTGKVIVTA